jgi:hypothetical protein
VYSRIVDHLLEQRRHLRSGYALSVNTKCLYHALRARQSGFVPVMQPKRIDMDALDLLNGVVEASLSPQSVTGEFQDRIGASATHEELDTLEPFEDVCAEDSTICYMIFEIDL